MSAPADCLFCRIARHELPAHVVFEDERTIAFLDINPCSWGHTVVISKLHSSGLTDLPPGEVGPLFGTVQRLADRLTEALPTVGLTIGVNHGQGAGQIVPHLHVHLIPRYAGDGGTNIHSVVHQTPPESVEATAKTLKIS
jgi:histidine triad (HIT) family protein